MKRFLKSVGYALKGWKAFFGGEKNGQIQLVIGIATIIAGFAFHLSISEWIAILFCLALIPALEMLNSALEKLCDLVEPAKNDKIRFIKDVAAGAVLWSTIFVIIIGGIIFLPKILDCIKLQLQIKF